MTRHPKRYHCRYRRKCNLSILIFPFSPHEPIEICQSRASSTWRRHSVCAIPILPYFPCNSPSSLNSNSRLLSSPSPFPLLRFLPPFPVATRPWRRQRQKVSEYDHHPYVLTLIHLPTTTRRFSLLANNLPLGLGILLYDWLVCFSSPKRLTCIQVTETPDSLPLSLWRTHVCRGDNNKDDQPPHDEPFPPLTAFVMRPFLNYRLHRLSFAPKLSQREKVCGSEKEKQM